MTSGDLRELAVLLCANDFRPGDAAKALHDAANEIDRLQRELDGLRITVAKAAGVIGEGCDKFNHAVHLLLPTKGTQ